MLGVMTFIGTAALEDLIRVNLQSDFQFSINEKYLSEKELERSWMKRGQLVVFQSFRARIWLGVDGVSRKWGKMIARALSATRPATIMWSPMEHGDYWRWVVICERERKTEVGQLNLYHWHWMWEANECMSGVKVF